MSTPKKKGYQAEVRVRDELAEVGFDGMKRTGSVAYQKDAPDLVNRFGEPWAGPPIHVVAVVLPRQPVMYVMDADALRALLHEMPLDAKYRRLYVQVKRRAKFVGFTWWRKLVEGARRWERPNDSDVS